MLFNFIYKTSYLNEEDNCTEPSPHLAFPADLPGVVVIGLDVVVNGVVIVVATVVLALQFPMGGALGPK
jgi:hypothetical protein